MIKFGPIHPIEIPDIVTEMRFVPTTGDRVPFPRLQTLKHVDLWSMCLSITFENRGVPTLLWSDAAIILLGDSNVKPGLSAAIRSIQQERRIPAANKWWQWDDFLHILSSIISTKTTFGPIHPRELLIIVAKIRLEQETGNHTPFPPLQTPEHLNLWSMRLGITFENRGIPTLLWSDAAILCLENAHVKFGLSATMRRVQWERRIAVGKEWEWDDFLHVLRHPFGELYFLD